MVTRVADAPQLVNGAGISEDGLYRYWLTRSWGPGEWVNFICLNPSTADALVDDPTVRRLRGFAQRWGYGGFWLTNLFAYRATDPRALRGAADPVGPDNDEWLLRVAYQSPEIVAAWGADDHRERMVAVIDLLRACHLSCFGLTKDGLPKHPLYLRGDTVMHTFVEAGRTALRGKQAPK